MTLCITKFSTVFDFEITNNKPEIGNLCFTYHDGVSFVCESKFGKLRIYYNTSQRICNYYMIMLTDTETASMLINIRDSKHKHFDLSKRKNITELFILYPEIDYVACNTKFREQFKTMCPVISYTDNLVMKWGHIPESLITLTPDNTVDIIVSKSIGIITEYVEEIIKFYDVKFKLLDGEIVNEDELVFDKQYYLDNDFDYFNNLTIIMQDIFKIDLYTMLILIMAKCDNKVILTNLRYTASETENLKQSFLLISNNPFCDYIFNDKYIFNKRIFELVDLNSIKDIGVNNESLDNLKSLIYSSVVASNLIADYCSNIIDQMGDKLVDPTS